MTDGSYTVEKKNSWVIVNSDGNPVVKNMLTLEEGYFDIYNGSFCEYRKEYNKVTTADFIEKVSIGDNITIVTYKKSIFKKRNKSEIIQFDVALNSLKYISGYCEKRNNLIIINKENVNSLLEKPYHISIYSSKSRNYIEKFIVNGKCIDDIEFEDKFWKTTLSNDIIFVTDKNGTYEYRVFNIFNKNNYYLLELLRTDGEEIIQVKDSFEHFRSKNR